MLKNKESRHIPVMLENSIKFLNIKKNGVYIDCTFGDGGHSLAIYKKISKNGKLISFELDNNIDINSNLFFSNIINKNFFFVNDNFLNFDLFLKKNNIEKIDGFFFDLGISSSQLLDKNRGFSYRINSELDMRINKNNKLNASYIINNYSIKQLEKIFKELGEERKSKKIAEKICKFREKKKITNTTELCGIITSCFEKKESKKHPAKKIFQSLRIFINNELNNLFLTLKKTPSFLKKGGKIIVITYHSLEDRIVKRIFKQMEEKKIIKIITKKPITSTKEEILNNNKARSAKLRSVEKI